MNKTVLYPQKGQIFPFVREFIDYHDIEWELDKLRERYGKQGTVILSREIAFDGSYWGLFWVRGRKPSKKDIRVLLEEADFSFELEHAEIR